MAFGHSCVCARVHPQTLDGLRVTVPQPAPQHCVARAAFSKEFFSKPELSPFYARLRDSVAARRPTAPRAGHRGWAAALLKRRCLGRSAWQVRLHPLVPPVAAAPTLRTLARRRGSLLSADLPLEYAALPTPPPNTSFWRGFVLFSARVFFVHCTPSGSPKRATSYPHSWAIARFWLCLYLSSLCADRRSGARSVPNERPATTTLHWQLVLEILGQHIRRLVKKRNHS
jgi:hypothetical protein